MKRYFIFLTVILIGFYYSCSIAGPIDDNKKTNTSGNVTSNTNITSNTNTNAISNAITEINYDNGYLEAGVLNDSYPVPYEVGVYFSPSKLSGYIGKSIQSIKFYYACENGTGACIGVYLYSVKTDHQRGDQLYVKSIQQYSIVPGWNTTDITPFVIPTEGVWVVIYMAQWTSSECIIMDSANSTYQDGINVNQINGVASDSVGYNHNLLIRINVK